MARYTNILYKNGQGIPAVHAVLYTSLNVKVTATSTEGRLGVNDLVNGRYTFEDIDPGQYQVRFFGEGFNSSDYITIDVAGDSINISKEILLERLLEQASAIVWSSRSIIDTMVDTTAIIRNTGLTTLIISNGGLRLPSTTEVDKTEWYYTNDFETSITDNIITGVDTAVCSADFLQGSGDIKIQSQFDSSNWYTWLDTSISTNNLSIEKSDLEFTDGTKLRLRIGITPGPDNTGGQVNHVALYSGPDLFSII